MRQPLIQFGSTIGFANKLNPESNLGKGHNADVELVQCAAGYERQDFLVGLWPT